MTMKKISPIRFSWLCDRNNATTLTLAELKNTSLIRRDCGGDTANPSAALMEMTDKKRACIRKDCEGDTSTTIDTSGRKDCGGDTANPLAALMEATKKKRACITKNCEGDMSTAMDAFRRKDCGGDTANPSAALMEIPPIRFSWLCDRNNATTLTLAELKNTSLKRRDCGGDTANTSGTAEKKRSCRREDCEGDATSDTMSTVIEMKKKRAYKRKACEGDATADTTSTVIEIKKKRAYRRKKYLPHDLIVEQILTRLPVPSLLKSVRVSKLWYNSIHTDRKRFTHSHFLQSKKQPRVIFSLLDVRDGDTETTGEATYACHFFKFTNGLYGTENPLKYDSFPCYQTHNGVSELVGYCNGLPCMAFVGDYSTGYIISDPNRKDHLYIFYPAHVGKHISNAHIICHGFGFDSSANEYKVVSIFRTPQKELNFVVFTLGTKSWRDVTDTTTLISGYGGSPITKMRAPTGSDKSAIFCAAISSSGCLVWKIIATFGGAGSNHIQHDSEMEMLLSFNLHDEKFQLIQLPAKSTTDEQQKHLHVDYPHLLEFKGSPCIARIEKKSGNGNDYPHRCRDDHPGSTSCCCCCKVHLYILKDKVKQAWVKEESFDVRVNSSSKLVPDPCCFCFDSTTTTTTTTPPTRIFSFSDQMLLYWFNGKSLQVHNLCSKKSQLVLPTDREERAIFRAKLKEPRRILNSDDDDNNIYCSNMDYQLHCHEENFLSLDTFIPEGVTGVDAAEFSKLVLERNDSPCSAYLFIYRGSEVFYPFFS